MNSTKAVDDLSQGVGNVNLGGSDGGVWEQASRRKPNRAGSGAAKTAGWSNLNPNARAWGPDAAQRLGIRGGNVAPSAGSQGGRDLNPRSAGSESVPVAGTQVAAAQGNAWNSVARRCPSQVSEEVDKEENRAVTDDEDDDDDDFDDDDYLLDDDYVSDESPKTHETRKKQKMLKEFFATLDKLTLQELNDPLRQWHCPACQNGPGSIDWYKGLQPLITHARTKGSKRVKLHREFADLLDEELRRRGTSAMPFGELFGQWEGLKEQTKDHEIVWPPMVIVMNTLLEKDDNDKWLGMGNQELIDYFQGYSAVKARHSYGPKGHRGMSVLIFEGSSVGYHEAERLHKHFLSQGTGRTQWESNKRVLFYPGGKRQLYGFLARKEDLEEFNRHCQGNKTRLNYDMRSFQEKVVSEMRQMKEDNEQLTWFKHKMAKEQRNSKALQESFNVVSEKLRKTMEENRIVRQRTKLHHEQNKQEMDYQEQFFKDQIQKIHEATDAKEDKFEMLQQEQRKKVADAQASNMGDQRRREDEITKFMESQEQEMGKFVAEREELMRLHDDKKMEMKKRHWEEEVELEKEFDAALTKLMAKYAPAATGAAAAADA